MTALHTSKARALALNAIFLIAAYALSAGVSGLFAQQMYRCGNSYSQSPCPGGSVVEGAAPSSPEQKRQADAATQRDAQAADRMEQERLRAEAQANRANAAAARAAVPSAAPASAPRHNAGKHAGQHSKKKGKAAPEFFTATPAGEGKKKPASKKTAAKP